MPGARRLLKLATAACAPLATTGCATRAIVYPVCINAPVSAGELAKFKQGVEAAADKFFGDRDRHLLTPTFRSVTAWGSRPQHRRFVNWLVLEGCLPKFKDDGTRGQYVVCAEYMERLGDRIVDLSFQRGGKPDLITSRAVREMDRAKLLCHRDWSEAGG